MHYDIYVDFQLGLSMLTVSVSVLVSTSISLVVVIERNFLNSPMNRTTITDTEITETKLVILFTYRSYEAWLEIFLWHFSVDIKCSYSVKH